MSVIRRIRACRRDESGSATVEFVLWLPIFFMVFCGATDATLLMHKQTQMIAVARSAARAVSMGVSSQAEAEAFALQQMNSDNSENVSVTVQNGFVTATLNMPYSDVVIFGSFLAGDSALGASVTMVDESSTNG